MPNMYGFMKEYKSEILSKNKSREKGNESKLTEKQINEIFEKTNHNSKEVKRMVNLMCNDLIWHCGKDIESLNRYYDMGNMMASYRETFALVSEMMNMFIGGSVAPSYISEKFIKTWRFLNQYGLVDYANEHIIEYTIDKRIMDLERDKENDNVSLISRLRAINSSLRELL